MEELKNMETMFRATIAESNIGLNTLMNRDVHVSFGIDTTVVLKPYQAGLALAADFALGRSDILTMQSTIESMRLDRERMYAERKPNEPMTTQPSVGKTKTLIFDPTLMVLGEVQ